MSTQTLKEQSAYSEAFHLLRDRLQGSSAAWIERLREGAFDRFDLLGFPTTSDEEWKYTNVAPLSKLNFRPLAGNKAGSDPVSDSVLEAASYHESRRSQVVFVNGQYRSDLTKLDGLPGGVVALDLAQALKDESYAEIIRGHLARAADYNEVGFTALNTAFIESGAFVLIPEGLDVSVPVHLLFLANANAADFVCSPRVLVVAQRDSSVTLIESYSGVEDVAYWTNTVAEIVLEEGARVVYYKLQHESNEAFHTATTAAELGRNSVFDTTTITLGAKLSRHDIHVKLDHEGASCHVDGLYVVGGRQHTDTHSMIDHLKPHCTSRQLYKGILDGNSRAVFNGKVFVHPGAQQTDAQQTNRNLLLSNNARVDTKPQLEIFADDVKCAHGATVGQLEEEELFYLVSRGLHPELAQNLLTFGFAEEVIDRIEIESIKAQLGEVVLNRLHARLEV
jgi:Fe-S cluster assembly protein SufD